METRLQYKCTCKGLYTLLALQVPMKRNFVYAFILSCGRKLENEKKQFFSIDEL